MGEKIVINLDPPRPASDDCLPHAAMTLGSLRGGMHPRAALVHRLVIQQQSHGDWLLIRMDNCGGFIGDTSHATKEDALRSASREFGIDVQNYS